MSSKKSRKVPFIIVFIIVCIVVYLFANLKQSEVTCEKTSIFDSNISVKEKVITTINNQDITSLKITKTIILPEKYTKDNTYINEIKEELNKKLEYLGNKVKYTIENNRIIVDIDVHNNEVVLLDNIKFNTSNDFKVIINSNTKSKDVITLKIGDDYTDGEFMKRLKKDGYSCK